MLTEEERYKYLFYVVAAAALAESPFAVMTDEDCNELMLDGYEFALETEEALDDEKLSQFKKKFDEIEQLYLKKIRDEIERGTQCKDCYI